MNGCGCHRVKCRLPTGDPVHGSDNGYRNYSCGCAACTRAHRWVHAEAKANRIARGIPEHIHGTPNCYANYDCRRPECMKAFKARYRGYRNGPLQRLRPTAEAMGRN